MKILLTLVAMLILLSLPVFGNDSPKALQDAFVRALEANDADGLAACYAPDAVNFPVDSMMGVGPDSVRASWQAFFELYTVTGISLSETRMETFGDTAAAWGIFTMMVEPVAGGEPVEMRGRFMDVAKIVNGNWLYIADHASVPAVSGE
jgi:uncharacterized protein (TIGR02246 family)